MGIVAEKTGYPKEMLDVDLDLEADLGIDTVKQAEMFAAIRATYSIPREENLKLRDFPTLAHVIKFAQDRSGLLTSPEPGKLVTEPEPPTASPTPKPALLTFDAANNIPRRVPIPVLRPPLHLCKATGATLERGQRVVIMPDHSGVADALSQSLERKRHHRSANRSDSNPDALTELMENWIAAGPVQGVFWLPALDIEGDLNQMDVPTWHEAIRVRIKSLYTVMRALYEQIALPGTFLVSATQAGWPPRL